MELNDIGREHLNRFIKSCILKLRWIPVKMAFRGKGFRGVLKIFSHLTSEERFLLYHLGIKRSPGSTFVEIGSYLGASSCFLAAAAIERNAELHCVDTWFNNGMSEGRRDTWKEFKNNTLPFSSVINMHRGLSTEVASCFTKYIDLLFIDGDHTYDACKADLEAWLPHLKPGGILVMHDYGWAEGVIRVVDEIVKPRQKCNGHVMQNTYWTKM